jgi:Mg-chelatase subunit ChlD
MSAFRPWAFWRRLQYGAGFGVFWLLIGVVVYYTNFYVQPTCFDNVQNADEGGVDCDGSCVRICSASVIPPRVVWADSFKIVDGQYNAVAYIENVNPVAATRELAYTFKLLESGTVIAERSGTTILPPNSAYPIFEGRILTEAGREPTETQIELREVDVWQPATLGRSQFRVNDFKLESADSRPRLTAEVENVELTGATAVEVVATIFNAAGKPLTASRTFVDNFASRTVRDVVFTWPGSIAKTVRSCDVPSDIMLVLDRSGSMAADGGEPPEPLASAKVAAQNFVGQVKQGSQIGFLSYATTPTTPLEQVLTSDVTLVKKAIAEVAMGEDGVQYTNMGDAFKSAYEELASTRHREDARKVIIFMTDGDVTRPVNPETGELDRVHAAAYAKEMASLAKANDTIIYTIGFGDVAASDGTSLDRDAALVRDLASLPEYYFEAPTIADLLRVYREIASGLCEDGPTRVEILTKTATNFTPLR